MDKDNLTYSQVIYYFGDKFTTPAGILGAKEELPDGKRVMAPRLAEVMVLGALVYLVENEYLSLELKEFRRFFFFKHTELCLFKRRSDAGSLNGIELTLFNNVDEEQGTPLLHAVVALLRQDVSNPWSAVMNQTKRSMASIELLNVEEVKRSIGAVYKYHYNDELNVDLLPQLKRATDAISRLHENIELYDMCYKEIETGLKLREHKNSKGTN